jgi:hypothetical protein
MTSIREHGDSDLAKPPDLDRSMVVDQATRQAFARDGHVAVRGLLAEEEAAAYQAVVSDARRRGGPIGMWRRSPDVARFVQASLFGQVAADLIGADGMRLYHDMAFWKGPARARPAGTRTATTCRCRATASSRCGCPWHPCRTGPAG